MKNIATLLVHKLTILVVGGGITFLFIIGGLQLISEGGVCSIIGGVVVFALGLTGIKPTWESLWNKDENASLIRFSKPSLRASLADNIDRIRTLCSWKRRRATRKLFEVLVHHLLDSQAQSTNTLLKSGADIGAKIDTGGWGRSSGKTPLMWAAGKNARPEAIETLLAAGADSMARNKHGNTPLGEAAFGNSNPRVIQILLKAGADIGYRDISGSTPLGNAAKRNSNPKIIETLLEAGADLEARDNLGNTPLMEASEYNSNPEVIETLLKAGSDIEARDGGGRTPLMLAVGFSSTLRVIEALLKAGANAKKKDQTGRTVADFAKHPTNLISKDVLEVLERTKSWPS